VVLREEVKEKNGKSGGLLFLAAGGMELSWRLAVANFMTISLLNRPFPLKGAIGTFVVGAFLSLGLRRRGWRVICVLGLHLAGFGLTTLGAVYAFYALPGPFFDPGWVITFFSSPRGFLEWLELILVLSGVLLFWLGGSGLIRRAASYVALCSRFDLGVGAFALIFFIKLLVVIKAAAPIEETVSLWSLIPFFVFGLLAIGLARNRSREGKAFLSGYQGFGVTMVFTLGVLMVGVGVVSLFFPYLRLSAEMGYTALTKTAAPLAPFLIRFLRFIFGPGIRRAAETSAPSGGLTEYGTPQTSGEGGSALLQHAALWVFAGLGILVLIVTLTVGLRYLFRWLLRRTPEHSGPGREESLLLFWYGRWRRFMTLFWMRIYELYGGYKEAISIFRAFLRWGRYSGLPRCTDETPREYGERLKRRFPEVAEEIGAIVGAFNLEFYGGAHLDTLEIGRTRLALSRLRSPLLWPSRLRSRILQIAPDRPSPSVPRSNEIHRGDRRLSPF
jgi:hypothetical protein